MHNMLIAFMVAFVAAVPATMTAGQQQQEEQQEEPRRQSLVPGRAAFAAEPEPCDVGLTLLEYRVLEGNFEMDERRRGAQRKAILTDWAVNYELAEGYNVQWSYEIVYRSTIRERRLRFRPPAADDEREGMQWYVDNGIAPVYVSRYGDGVVPYEEGMKLEWPDEFVSRAYDPEYYWGSWWWSRWDSDDYVMQAVETEDGTRYARIIDDVSVPDFFPPEDSYVPERLKREWREQQWREGVAAWTEWEEDSNRWDEVRNLSADADILRYKSEPVHIDGGERLPYWTGRASYQGGWDLPVNLSSTHASDDIFSRDDHDETELVSLEVLDIVLIGDVLCQRKSATFLPPPDGP